MKKALMLITGLIISFSCQENNLSKSKTKEQMKSDLIPKGFEQGMQQATSSIISGLSSNGDLLDKQIYSIELLGKMRGQSDLSNRYNQALRKAPDFKESSVDSLTINFSSQALLLFNGLADIAYKADHYQDNQMGYDFEGYKNYSKNAIDSLENKIILSTDISDSEKSTLLMATTAANIFLPQLETFTNLIVDSTFVNGKVQCLFCNIIKAVVHVATAIVQVATTVVAGAFVATFNGAANQDNGGVIAAPFCGIAGAVSGFYNGIKYSSQCYGKPPFSNCYMSGISGIFSICS